MSTPPIKRAIPVATDPFGGDMPPRQSQVSSWDRSIMVGDGQDGHPASPIRREDRRPAVLPPEDPVRAIKGDVGDAAVVRASVRASGGPPPTPYRTRAAPAAPTPSHSPIRFK